MSTNNVSGNPQRGSSGSEGMLLVCCAIIEHGGKTLAVQRGEQMDLPLKWEFPGGKVKPNEAETLCVIREVFEELNLIIKPLTRLTPIDFQYPDKIIRLIPFISECVTLDKHDFTTLEIKLKEHKEYRWLNKSELSSLDWAPADIPALEEYLGR